MMPQVTIVVRELGSTRPDYSLLFTLPDIPCVGDYISVHREDTPTPHGEDLVVRRIWWRLETSEVRTAPPAETVQAGDVREIVVECDPALGPYSSDRWRASLEAAKKRGVAVEEFDIVRFSVRERDLPKPQKKKPRERKPRPDRQH
jgi:hypothetical protein